MTRGDIEQVRGVSVSQNIMRTLLERDWIRVVGQREAPGRPSMYGTTKAFLDYFDLAKLEDLPPLEEIKAMIEPALVAEGGASVDGAGDANEDQGASEPTDPAHEPDLSAAPEAEQPTHS